MYKFHILVFLVGLIQVTGLLLGSREEAEIFDSLSPDESKERLAPMLKEMDRNRDKRLDTEELLNWIVASLKRMGWEGTKQAFNDIDNDKNGFITWKEILLVTSETISAFASLGFELDLPLVDMVACNKNLFIAADLNKDGKMNVREYARFQRPQDYPNMIPIVLKNALRRKDKDGDFRLNFTECAPSNGDYENRKLSDEERKFLKYDKNEDGFLDGDEIIHWDAVSTLDMAKDELDELIRITDSDEDGILTFDEILTGYENFVGTIMTEFRVEKIRHFLDEL